MPLNTHLHTRGPRPSSTHQWAGSNSFHQEDFMSLQTSFIYHGAVTRDKKSMVLQPENWVWVWRHWSEPAVEPAGPWALVVRGDCTAVIHRKSPTEGDFAKVKKRNSPSHTNVNRVLNKMRLQRNMFQVKGKNKTSEELSEVERDNVPKQSSE